MNREIKFRAWNEENTNATERMILPATLTCDGKVVMPDGEDWVLPVMQFTGLLDKNGKECYEGDIVAYKERGEKRMLVKWVQRGFWVVEDGGELYWPYEFEIIGNIYETPTLLSPN